LFEKAINMTAKPEECARELLDVVPLIMRDIRTQMRRRRTPDLTVPQFRTLLFVSRNAGASLSEVADHIGLALSSTSKLVDDLIRGGLMTRQEQSSDRRRVSLVVTPRGATLLEVSRKGTLEYLAEKLEGISGAERETILKAIKGLRCVFHN
jgi:DNA-binding MarR family transcriptional regulator